MRAEDLLTWNRAVPFAPYRIRYGGGRTFEVRHPKMVVVGRETVNLYTFAKSTDGPFDRLDVVSLLFIEGVEPASPAAAA